MNNFDDDNYDDREVSLNMLKELHNVSVMAWHGHGGYNMYDGSFLCTGERYSQSLYHAYADDIDRGRIVVAGNRCCITGGFIEKYCRDMTGNFYYLGTCSSGKDMLDGTQNNFELAQAFINKGATAVVANSSTITTNYNTKMEKAVYSALSSQDSSGNYYTLENALKKAKDDVGQRDPNQWNGEYARVMVFPQNNTAALNYRLSANGALSGSVKDASTSNPVSNALVRIYDPSGTTLIKSIRTNNFGSYNTNIAPGHYVIKISCSSYKTVKMAVSVVENTTTYNENFLLLQNSIVDIGKANGVIINAITSVGVPDVTVKLRSNWNNKNGRVEYTTTTNENGFYEISGVVGPYTMEYFKSGYNVGYKNVLLAVDYMAQNAVISPITSEGVYRIVLSWSSLPYDLDSHLTGPLPESLQESANGENGRFHMYYPYAEANEGSLFPEYVALDLDNTDIVDLPYVPETTTIRQMLNGTYRYSVHDFSNSGDETSTDLSSSNAKVEVFKGSTLIQTYHVPSNIAGTIWNVFELSGDQLTPLNRFTNGNADDASKY